MNEAKITQQNDAPLPPSPQVVQEEDGIDLHEIVAILNANKWLIAAVTAIVFAISLLYAFLATPVYEADALIQIEQQQSPFSSGQSSNVLSMFLPVAAPADTEIQIMQSRSVLRPVVDELGLNIAINPHHIPVIGHFSSHIGRKEVGIKTLIVPGDWLDEDLTLKAGGGKNYTLYSPGGKAVVHGVVGRPSEGPNGKVKILVERLNVKSGKKITVVRYPDQEAVDSLKQQLSAAEQGRDTGIVLLSLEGSNPTQIKQIVNAVSAHYISQNVAENASQAQKSLQFINGQLPSLKKQLDAAQSKLTAYRSKHGVINLDAQTQAMLQEMTNLQTQLSQLQMTASALKQEYTAKFPAYISLKNQEDQIQNKINTLESQVALLPKKEQGYVSLMTNTQVLEQLYTALLSKAQDLQVAEAGTLGSARIVDHAVTPLEPIKPRKALTAIIGFILGLFLGVLAAFLRRALFRAVVGAEELEQDLGLPVYAVIQHSDTQVAEMRKRKAKRIDTLPLLAAEYPDDMTVEAIRSLRTSLGVALLDSPRKIVTFIGTASGVGKSFMAANVAHVMGASGNRVLVIDADLRRGHLHHYFNTRRKPGLSAFMAGEAELQDVILPSAYDSQVDFIPTGQRSTDPYTLISSPRFSAMMMECADNYDFVLVDVPPILAVAEGLAVARLATANLLVVKAGKQTKHEIRLAMNRMQQNDAIILGFILNDLTKRAAAYSYGRYGYAYQYQYKYENDKS